MATDQRMVVLPREYDGQIHAGMVASDFGFSFCELSVKPSQITPNYNAITCQTCRALWRRSSLEVQAPETFEGVNLIDD